MKSELELLKERADRMGIPYHSNIGVTKLKERLAEKKGDGPTVAEAGIKVETKAARSLRQRKNAERLVRVNITCMNPHKAQWPGEIYSVSNKSIGTVKKFIPFNTEAGYHIPVIILDMLKEKKYRKSFEKMVSGKKVRYNKLVTEFGIEYLPALTKSELLVLAAKQAKDDIEG